MTTRTISASGQFTTLFGTQLGRTAKSKKTLALLAIHMVPVIAALIYVIAKDADGSTLFRQIVSQLTYPYLIPMTALFYGGPAIVEELEGRTLTYLTLRPIPRALLYLGKVLAVICVSLGVVLGPLLLLWVVSLATSADMGATFGALLSLIGGAAVGTAVYCAIFAALGALFTTSLVASIIYAVVFEVIFAALPILEMLSIRYYMRTMGGLNADARLGLLKKIILDKPIIIPEWAGFLIGFGVLGLALAGGSWIFRSKQYHV